MEVLATNTPGARALYEPVLPYGNLIRFTFLDLAARVFYRDWQEIAEAGIAWLRATAGLEVRDARLTEIVDELGPSDAFRGLWGRYEVQDKRSDIKRLCHPVVGDLSLHYQIFLDRTAGQYLLTYQAEPGSPSEKALAALRDEAATG